MLENFRLRVFREVARQQSFRRAAEVLHISQPAVTQQIKALEEELGCQLLDRTGGHVRLTALGALLLRHAESSEATLRRALEEMASLEGELRGSLRIAASTTIAQYILPPLLSAFGREHPGVALELESANTEKVVSRLADGSAMLGLVEGPAHRSDLQIDPWIEDELVLVVPAAHEWAGQRITRDALSRVPLLLREPGSGTRDVLDSALRAAGLPLESLSIAMQLSSTEALLACVEAGLGLCFASRFSLRRQRRLGTLAIVRVEGLRVRRTLSLVRQQGAQDTGVIGSFSTFLFDYARDRQARCRSKAEKRDAAASLGR